MSVNHSTAAAESLDPFLVDGNEAARLLSVCRKTVDNLAKRGLLRAIKIGAATRYSLAELRQFVEDQHSEGSLTP